MLRLLFSILLVSFYITPVSASSAEMELISVETSYPVHPILIGKSNNILLHFEIITKGTSKPLAISDLKLAFGGTIDPININRVAVMFTEDSAQFFLGQAFDIGKPGASTIDFQGNLRLQEGINHLWVTCELSPSTPLDNKMSVICTSLSTNYGTKTHAPKNPTEIPLFAIGHALRQNGQDGVHTYRIPGLATTNSGTLIAVYDIRRNSSTDLQEDVDIGMNRSIDGGQTWEPMKIIMDMGEWGGKPEIENGIGDPSILVDKTTGTIWVSAIWAHGHPGKRNWRASGQGMKPAETSQWMISRSDDDGKTWSTPINITEQIKHPDWHLVLQGPGKGITLKDGTLVFPAQFKDENEVPHSTMIHSKDHGKTWTIGTGAKSHTTESQIVELRSGALLINMRDDRGRNNEKGGKRAIAVTHDLGKTWSPYSYQDTLLEPVCMGSLIRSVAKIGDQKQGILLFSNPAVPKGPRRQLTIKVSFDEGRTWPSKYHTLIREENCYGYSCMTMINEETLGILYEGNGELYFQRFNLLSLLNEN